MTSSSNEHVRRWRLGAVVEYGVGGEQQGATLAAFLGSALRTSP
jgi:hypothetical protein